MAEHFSPGLRNATKRIKKMDLQTIDLSNPTANIETFQQTDLALADLTKRFDVVPEVATKDGYEFAKSAIKEISGFRTKLEKSRKEYKSPILEAGRILDSEAKRITDVLVSLETPFKNAKHEQDNIAKLAKEKRLAGLTAKIDEISETTNLAFGKTAVEIKAILDAVSSIDTLEGYYDLTDLAISTQVDTIKSLTAMHQQAEDSERIAIERAEFKKQLDEANAKLASTEAVEPTQQASPVETGSIEQPAPRAMEAIQTAPAKQVNHEKTIQQVADFFSDSGIDDINVIAEFIVMNRIPMVNVTIK